MTASLTRMEPHRPGHRPSWLGPLDAALERSPRTIEFFLRDDDAGWGDERLFAFLEVVGRHELPVDLAVIPRELTAGLARRLLAEREATAGRIALHQHGLAHENHEPTGRKCEFGQARRRRAQRRDIEEGAVLLRELLGEGAESIFTPPWNRCTRATAECLSELGFRALSTGPGAEPFGVPGLAELPVTIDWFAHRHGVRLTRPELGEQLARAVEEQGAGASARPVGVMFHHAVMDVGELHAAGELLALLAGHRRARCRSMGELLVGHES